MIEFIGRSFLAMLLVTLIVAVCALPAMLVIALFDPPWPEKAIVAAFVYVGTCYAFFSNEREIDAALRNLTMRFGTPPALTRAFDRRGGTIALLAVAGLAGIALLDDIDIRSAPPPPSAKVPDLDALTVANTQTGPNRFLPIDLSPQAPVSLPPSVAENAPEEIAPAKKVQTARGPDEEALPKVHSIYDQADGGTFAIREAPSQ